MNREAIFLFLLGCPPFPVLNYITSVAFSSSVAADVYIHAYGTMGTRSPLPANLAMPNRWQSANTPCAAPHNHLAFPAVATSELSACPTRVPCLITHPCHHSLNPTHSLVFVTCDRVVPRSAACFVSHPSLDLFLCHGPPDSTATSTRAAAGKCHDA